MTNNYYETSEMSKEEIDEFVRKVDESIGTETYIEETEPGRYYAMVHELESAKEVALCLQFERSVIKYRWRDRKGVDHHPHDMHTTHIFHTIIMIWNHSVPVDLQFRPFNKYEFPEFYTQQYMKDTVYYLVKELQMRRDLTPKMIEKLQELTKRYNSSQYYHRLSDQEWTLCIASS